MEPRLSEPFEYYPMTNVHPAIASPIDEFIKNPWFEHYEALAERARSLLEAELHDARDSDRVEVQFRITCRAKTPASLRNKLEARNKEKRYKDTESILADVKDIAGVRVILYTPSKAQRCRVTRAIKSIWGKEVQERFHGIPIWSRKVNPSRIDNEYDSDSNDDNAEGTTDNGEVYERKHAGYQASHYRARMLEGQGDKSYKYHDNDWVEIQVVSALSHVWAEASHDVMYKTLAYGDPTILEHRILDALSGLIISGDLLLEQFRESVTKRTYTRWNHLEEFAIWFRESDVMKQKQKQNKRFPSTSLVYHFNQAGTNILYRFLKKIDKNYPIAVRDELKELNFPDDPETGLEKERAMFGCGFKPPHGLLAPLCIISRLMRSMPLETRGYNTLQKCNTMMDAFLLLQTFSGTAADAREYLLNNVKAYLNREQLGSIDFVLHDPHRDDCLGKFDDQLGYDRAQTLQPGWDWFIQQANGNSLCGLFFRLAVMGVPAEELADLAEDEGFTHRMKQLQIKSLSRAKHSYSP